MVFTSNALPRRMNLMAYRCPVRASVASCTNPEAPLHTQYPFIRFCHAASRQFTCRKDRHIQNQMRQRAVLVQYADGLVVGVQRQGLCGRGRCCRSVAAPLSCGSRPQLRCRRLHVAERLRGLGLPAGRTQQRVTVLATMTDAKSWPDPVVLKGWKSYKSDAASGAQGDSMQIYHTPGRHASHMQPIHL